MPHLRSVKAASIIQAAQVGARVFYVGVIAHGVRASVGGSGRGLRGRGRPLAGRPVRGVSLRRAGTCTPSYAERPTRRLALAEEDLLVLARADFRANGHAIASITGHGRVVCGPRTAARKRRRIVSLDGSSSPTAIRGPSRTARPTTGLSRLASGLPYAASTSSRVRAIAQAGRISTRTGVVFGPCGRGTEICAPTRTATSNAMAA